MPEKSDRLLAQCENIINAYRTGELGVCELPEDNAPAFAPQDIEAKLAYFTLPMALNYRRNSTQAWNAARATCEDTTTTDVFSVEQAAQLPLDELQGRLTKYKLALQPNRHTLTWSTVAKTVDQNWGTLEGFLESTGYDFLAIQEAVQHMYRKGFPYLAGPKLFNYWAFILGVKCGVQFKNKEYIDIAVDSHVLKCSVVLGVIAADEANSLPTEKVAERWRHRLQGSGIAPTDLNVPLWFWSRNGFAFEP
ncbi:MAG: hypothetical protein ACREGJ_03135 [Candidatus Saccharimonadales bacterium]